MNGHLHEQLVVNLNAIHRAVSMSIYFFSFDARQNIETIIEAIKIGVSCCKSVRGMLFVVGVVSLSVFSFVGIIHIICVYVDVCMNEIKTHQNQSRGDSTIHCIQTLFLNIRRWTRSAFHYRSKSKQQK